MRPAHHASRPEIILPTAFLLLIAGCGQSSSTATEAVADSTARALPLAAPAPPGPYAMPYMYKSELLCVAANFASSIRLGPVSAPTPIALFSHPFRVGDLKAALPGQGACAPGQGNIAGVVVHYGLDPAMRFDVALEFVCLRPDSGTYRYHIGTATTYYRIADGRLVDQHQGISNWDMDEGKRYADHVVLQLATDSAYTSFEPGRDVTSTVLRYDGQLDLLIAQNGLLDSDSLDLVPICQPRSRTMSGGGYIGHGLHQGISVIPVGITLDNVSYGPGHEYKAKAADFGSPCPPYEIDAVFPEHGLPRLPGC
jgi:hypothetical protein